MFARILLPLDGSELAEIALPYAEELTGKLGSELVLYHVPGHDHKQQEHMHQVYLDRLAENMQHNISKAQPMSSEVKVTTKVEAGEPTENICNLVEKNKMDLIIMTTVSTSGIRVGKMLGSVADHICRTVPIPILLIRPNNVRQVGGKDRLISRLLIPLDGSELSKLALPVGEELAANLKAGVTLFQMANQIRIYSNDMYGPSSAFVNYVQLNEDERARVDTEMSALEMDLKSKNLDVTHVVTSGFDAASDIIEVGKKVSADLVVMSTHGRSGLTRWILGNIAEKVLRHGETPLLLVHAGAG
jgi:nucleotide-binding universal stress UspA family protein